MIGTRNGQAKGLGLLAVVVALAACEPAVERPVARRQASITAGSPAPADGAVVAIVQRRVSCAEATTVVLCSGTLIAPRAVVTAAHCVADGPARRLEVRTTGAAGGVVEVRSIVEAHVHPSWNGADRAHDLAVVWLDRPSTATPIELPPPDAAALAI
ncbi:MAG: trypsin-like serine protease [Deltaproteobacteria bacterium]|nr:trypsin-like serine protease [Deltaproteobacteria bacterium]